MGVIVKFEKNELHMYCDGCGWQDIIVGYDEYGNKFCEECFLNGEHI